MLGAIIGDIVGSRFEWHNVKKKDFEFMSRQLGCRVTDDTIMSLAVAKALLECDGFSDLDKQAIKYMQILGRQYPNAGYGSNFSRWLQSSYPKPYHSYGNGAAMRVSACGFAARTIQEAKAYSNLVTKVTHDHPEGLKAAKAIAVAIFMARSGKTISEIRDHITEHYYSISFTLDSIRPSYQFDVTCPGSVPQAFEAFFESTGFEDAIRNAVSIGGDSDTIAAITGSIAEAYYGIPSDIRNKALTFLDNTQLSILNAFEERYGIVMERQIDPSVSPSLLPATGLDNTNLLSIEERMTSVESDALQEERDNVKANYQTLTTEYYAVHIPYPDITPYSTASGWEEIASLQDKKAQNQHGWDQQKAIKRYCDNDRLHCGHLRTSGGHDYFFMDSADLPTRPISSHNASITLVNVDDHAYTEILHSWRYPKQHKGIAFSRNISMIKREVEAVDIILDQSNELLSNITDAYLRKALLRNKGKASVQSIIQTIQQKQDNIRLLPVHNSFIVQGCAGSGKTMVLLHRLRYLLFNKEIEHGDYILLVPTNNFKRFVKDIAASFQISYQGILPIQGYYQMLSGKKPNDATDDISELVFAPQYLARVYSKAFIKECYGLLFDILVQQANTLIEFCETKLNAIIEEEENAIASEILRNEEHTVACVLDIVKDILPHVQVRIESIDSLPDLLSELTQKYDSIQQQYAKVAIPAEDIVISPDDERIQGHLVLKALRGEILAETERVNKASIFTASAHKKKLAKLEAQYEDTYRAIELTLIEVDKKAYAERAAKLRFVYEGVTLEAVDKIIHSVKTTYQSGYKQKRELEEKQDHFNDYLEKKYQMEIDLLNRLIEVSSSIPQDGNDLVEGLTCGYEYFSKQIDLARRLLTVFMHYHSQKENETISKHLKLFAGRTDQQLQAYLNTLLFNICKKRIKEEYGIVICDLYKHYWYISLYCQFLTRDKAYTKYAHVFIDEAQDLSIAEIELIRKINTVSKVHGEFASIREPIFNVFGDVNQMITEHGIRSWKDITFIDMQFVLEENFRNTNQIVDFCNRNLPFKMQKIGVDMEAVRKYATLDFALSAENERIHTPIFIVKDEYAAADLKHLLAEKNIVGYSIYTVKAVKGLEFNEIFVFDRDMTANEKYIAYTRSLAKLTVISELPHVVDSNKQLYIEGEDIDESE